MTTNITYSGFYNYTNYKGLPITKMITEEETELDTVIEELQGHSDSSANPLTSYHISVYLNGNKVKQTNLSEFRF